MLFKRATDTCLSLRLLVHAIQRQSSQDIHNGHHSLYQGYPIIHANSSTISLLFAFLSLNDQTLLLSTPSTHLPILISSCLPPLKHHNKPLLHHHQTLNHLNRIKKLILSAIIVDASPLSMVSPTSIKKKRSS